MTSPDWSRALRQVAAEEDLLRAQRQVGQLLGIDPRGPQAAELDLQSRSAGSVDLAEQLAGPRRRGRASRSSGGPSRRPATAMAFSTPGSKLLPAATAWNVPGLPFGQPPQPLGEGHRVGVAGGQDAVADVDHLRARARSAAAPRQWPCPDRSSPATSRAARNCRAAATFLASAGPRLLEGPVAIDVAGGQVDRVLAASATPSRAATNSACAARLAGVHRGRGVGQDQQFQRLAVGQQLSLPTGRSRAGGRRAAP